MKRMSAAALLKEQSPVRQWCDFANDINAFLSEPAPNVDLYIERIAHDWTIAEKKDLVEMYGGKKRKGLPNSGIKFLLSAFESEKSEAYFIILCRVLWAIFEIVSVEDRRKEKGIIKNDAVATLSRTIRKRLLLRIELNQRSQLDLEVDQMLYTLLYKIGLKDNRFNLKVRVSGLLPTMCRVFVKFDQLCPEFYTVFIRMARSPRNGQSIGRQDGFMAKLMARITSISENLDEISSVQLLDKHLQILFFTLKNRRTRLQTIRDSISRTIIDILRKQLSAISRPPRLLSSLFGTQDNPAMTSARGDVVIGCVAISRLLANNKKARDEMIQTGVLDICAKELKEMSKDAPKGGQRAKIVDSLCSLWLRCMPPVPYPLENVPFRLVFPLPPATPATPGGRVRNSSSINVSFDNGRSSDEDGVDDDEMAFQDQNASSNCEQSDDDEKEALPLPKTTKLTPTQLNKYAPFFGEFEYGCMVETSRNAEESWSEVCKRTKHVMPFQETLPLEMFTTPSARNEKLMKSTNSMSKLISDELEKNVNTKMSPKIVYDVDPLLFGENLPKSPGDDLRFESRFESGNLRRVTQKSPNHYELFLSPDLNQLRDHYQWFFFQVSNMRKGVEYTFEIANCFKSTSMYSEGMQPVMFSMADAGLGWKRVGENILYYRNLYTSEVAGAVDEKNGEERKKLHYYSIRFDITFKNTGDVCYIAYHYPYTYSFLMASLSNLRRHQLTAVYCREDVIGFSLAENAMKMLTITSACSSSEVSAKPVIVLSARVHPGESNSSWIMQGILENLLCGTSSEMYRLREQFVFKIIPMLNPDGVINGSHRCSLAGIDLNRVWDRPNEGLHPEIFHSKAIIQFLCDVLNKKPFAYVDLHGHSKKWDCFLFGNNPAESWRQEDVSDATEDDEYLALLKALEQTCSGKFNPLECKFSISRAKESSARVNVWRQFGVQLAYTLESTYCGFQMAQNKGFQINTDDLKEIGRDLLRAFLEVSCFLKF
ncbi:unnamed protein product [Caenorhabditis bovis]|uniref:Peptidase M14 domain-containing protein n=1 Tax=Caenorhabditis bovis TaxID=2654633 RepID=A0A8S1F650_9PELO|nr:unnamed protein product [Caenorhabditis bovis]